MPPLGTPPRGQVVTATNFVRNFAAYARNATTEPIHIFNHGRPAWSLVATEDLVRLVDASSEDQGEGRLKAKLDIVIDTVPTLIIMVDRDLNILRANLAARNFLQLSDDEIRGAALSDLLDEQKQAFVHQAARRVRDTGVIETFEMDSVDAPVRTFQVKIVPSPGGIAIFADEITHALAIRHADGVASALARAVDASPMLARVMVNMRGVIVSVSPGFAALTGIDEARILGLRFSAMFDAKSRGDMADGVEALLSDGQSFTGVANLLTHDARPQPVLVSGSSYSDYNKGIGALFLLQQAP